MQLLGIAFLNLLQMLSDDAGGLVQNLQIDFENDSPPLLAVKCT